MPADATHTCSNDGGDRHITREHHLEEKQWLTAMALSAKLPENYSKRNITLLTSGANLAGRWSSIHHCPAARWDRRRGEASSPTWLAQSRVVFNAAFVVRNNTVITVSVILGNTWWVTSVLHSHSKCQHGFCLPSWVNIATEIRVGAHTWIVVALLACSSVYIALYIELRARGAMQSGVVTCNKWLIQYQISGLSPTPSNVALPSTSHVNFVVYKVTECSIREAPRL